MSNDYTTLMGMMVIMKTFKMDAMRLFSAVVCLLFVTPSTNV